MGDRDEQVRALEGCAELYLHAARHLAADPPDVPQAAGCISTAVKTGMQVRQQAVVDYVLSGAATTDVLNRVRADLMSIRDDL